MSPDGLSCPSCKYWEASGQCKRFPPGFVSLSRPRLEDEVGEVTDVAYIAFCTTFPITGAQDWCGEHSKTPRNP